MSINTWIWQGQISVSLHYIDRFNYSGLGDGFSLWFLVHIKGVSEFNSFILSSRLLSRLPSISSRYFDWANLWRDLLFIAVTTNRASITFVQRYVNKTKLKNIRISFIRISHHELFIQAASFAQFNFQYRSVRFRSKYSSPNNQAHVICRRLIQLQCFDSLTRCQFN